MNPLNKDLFYRGFRQKLRSCFKKQRADQIWNDAGKEYQRILSEDPELKKQKGAMTIPAVAILRVMRAYGEDAVPLLKEYGDEMGRKFAGAVHTVTGIPGTERFIMKNMEGIMDRMSSEELGYRRRIVSEPPAMYGVDILSCPYHEMAKRLGAENAVLCICHMDKNYTNGFRNIRYDRNSAVSEGAECCEYRLYYEPVE